MSLKTHCTFPHLTVPGLWCVQLIYLPGYASLNCRTVEKQSNGSDCGVLTIAYAFDICNGLNPCNVRFDQNKIRQHLATCLEKCQISRFPVLGGRSSGSKKPLMVELHCSCCMPEEKGTEMAECDFCNVWYHRHCMDIPSEVFGEQEIPWKCKKCANSV